MHAEPFLLASSMTCVMGQRVVRKICEFCKVDYEPEDDVKKDFAKVLGPNLFAGILKQHGLNMDTLTLSRGEGCAECNNTGYIGRIGIFEVLPVSEKIGKLILEQAAASDIERVAVEEGMLLMKQDGYVKVVEKITTIEEVLRVAQI
jgi:type IV pilus assembly protein PilB